uniref:trimethylamine methyltransferase family protein n=1 Tax=uncultured Candidatus Puniceispirillum sp. TaxID=1985115 RepID=UPI0032B2B883
MARRGSSKRAGSTSKGRDRAASLAPASPYIKRCIPFYDILDAEQVDILEAQVDWILQEKGIAFFDDPEALDLWRREGATIGGADGNIVRASVDWIRDLCSKAPREFTQIARNPERSVVIGGQNQVFAPVYGAPFIRDLENGRRYGDIA